MTWVAEKPGSLLTHETWVVAPGGFPVDIY